MAEVASVSTPGTPAPQATEGSADLRAARPAAGARLRSWLKVIVVAFLAAIVLRMVAFEAYRIPSASMEETLLVGDFLFVSKLHYGARTPITIGLPFTGLYIDGIRLPAIRLPGFTSVQRGAVVVFNYPPDRAPIDRKTHYIKRVVALPGDTLVVSGKDVFVNGALLPDAATARRLWRVVTGEGVAMPQRDTLAALGFRGRFERLGPREWLVEGTEVQADIIRMQPGVVVVEPFVRPRGDGSAAFPPAVGYSLDEYGPLIVPSRGRTVILDDETWPRYHETIDRFEGVSVERVAGGFEIAGELTDRYTFRQDYFFVMGDNRDDSADSRSWGFVPASHLVGKAVLVYFSWDPVTKRPRWSRILRGID